MPRIFGDKSITPEKLEVFFKSLAETCQVTNSAKKAKLSVNALYNARKSDPDIAQRWEAAIDEGKMILEDMGFERAKISDTMLIFMLKGNFPNKYGDKQKVEHTGQVSVSLNMVLHGQKT